MIAELSSPLVVTSDIGLTALAKEVLAASRLAVDIEASGMFAYRARVCTLQLGWSDTSRVAIVDALSVDVSGLRAVLGDHGPVKVIHDVAFDARLLAEERIVLANVHDTAIAAQMLGRRATGLASLLGSELGISIDKSLQHHDWRQRPLEPAMLGYLAEDVLHLEALERKLWSELVDRGIEDAVLEETRYRLACARSAVEAPDCSPAYVRIKGFERLSEPALAALRALAELRDREAQRLDVPPQHILSNETLLTIARSGLADPSAVARVRGVVASAHGAALAKPLADAVAGAGPSVPECDRRWLERPRVPVELAHARRSREARMSSWRKAEAERRCVSEQVVLPGHCLRDLVQSEVQTVEDVARISGIGEFRVRRDGEAIVRALRATDDAP
ncbi:MAG: ribonuclease D [Polyangiaceae bacterium]|jgi:ribonuclease D